MELKKQVKIYIYSQKAETVPPLGTVLGNLGVNTVKFCQDFNEYTKDLPNYYLLPVVIDVYRNNLYKFTVGIPHLSSLINLLKFERTVKILGKDIVEECISSVELLKLAKFKFPDLPLEKAFRIVCGTVVSFNKLKIIS